MAVKAIKCTDYPTLAQYEAAITAYGSLGIEIYVTELDIKCEDGSLQGQTKLASLYKEIFLLFKRLKEDGVNITNVTIWGIADNRSWLSK